ncbi:hypothetical protein ACJMK2_014360 [Sinanodonta woodiana]|uniref:Uncharacterized protein n=1 Tax=Sinanodonta woodiana TaxID=1069815 RepID=A0ABD3V3H2_SINWO
MFPYENETDSWRGEIFVCQCSCQLKNYIPNGQILSESTIPHGARLNYKCDAGYEKAIPAEIVCFDGLLMTISDHSNYGHINTSFRQMSLPKTFAEDFNEYIFHLELNANADWSLPEEVVRYNQKVFRVLDNQTELLYYLHNGRGYQVGRRFKKAPKSGMC